MATPLPKTITREEAHALLEQPNLGCPTGLRDRCILELLYRAGLRISEALSLELKDYRPVDGQLHLRAAITKTKTEAYAYLEPETCRLLDLWIKTARKKASKGSRLLFTTLQGGRLDRSTMWEMVARRARRAGVERHVHPHMLRHSYATELLSDGFTLLEVQNLMRHASIRTTAVYLHISNEQMRQKVRGRQRVAS